MTHSSPQQKVQVRPRLEVFPGFTTPTSNTTFTPNQFFDVCLRYHSRGVVRLVAYLIRQTLGWCDADGRPLHERVQVSYRELIEKAGISRGVIRRSLDEAIAGGFIECVQAGKASTAHSKAESAHYQLRWDSSPEYKKDPKCFRGFFEGEGNRTDIPNQFFDHLIPHEPLSVVKVVGSVIRFSIGFQARHGRRRQQAALSYRDIERYARIRDTHTLAAAIRNAEQSHYILRLQDGIFDPNAGAQSRPAIFALRWADSSPFYPTGSISPAATEDGGRFKIPSGTGPKTPAANRFRNPSDIQTKLTKKIVKQQQAEVETPKAYAILKAEGFSEEAAKKLANKYPSELIRKQIEWLARRAPSRNRLGMLHRAIEENWPAPEELRHAEVSQESEFARNFYAGLAGNPGLPVAEPSHRDLQLAAEFVARLLKAKPKKVDTTAWARDFARHVRERRRETDVASLVLALRLHGDAWLLRFAQTQDQNRNAEIETARAAHRAKFDGLWLEFIAKSERTCRADRADEYAAFLKRVENTRWRLSAANPERERLVAFQGYFQLPDFWHWDAEFNSQPFSPCA